MVGLSSLITKAIGQQAAARIGVRAIVKQIVSQLILRGLSGKALTESWLGKGEVAQLGPPGALHKLTSAATSVASILPRNSCAKFGDFGGFLEVFT